MLFVLVLVVCVLFLANGAHASVRSRRTNSECWRVSAGAEPRCSVVLGELALVGLATGVSAQRWLNPRAGAAPGLALVARTSSGADRAWTRVLSRSRSRVRGDQGSSARCRVLRSRAAVAIIVRYGGSPVSHVRTYSRRPARLVSGALGLFIGVAAFAVLLAVQLAFQGQVVGSDSAISSACRCVVLT